MKSDTKEFMTIAAVIVGGIAVYKIAGGVSSAISDVGSGLGGGVNNLLSGAGQGVQNAGAGVEYLGYGAGLGVARVGSGIENIGAGVGGGLFQVGTGIQEIGRGAGYALSGANIQDIIQTIIPYGQNREASTYNSSIKLSQDQASNQGQDSTASTFVKSQSSTETYNNTYDLATGIYTSSSGQQSSMLKAPSGAAIINSSAGTSGTTTQKAPTAINQIITGFRNEGGILDYRKPLKSVSNVQSIFRNAVFSIFKR